LSDQSGLTGDQPFAKLLAVEVWLASGELQACAEDNNPAQPTVDEPTTYHRSRITVPALHAWGDRWQ